MRFLPYLAATSLALSAAFSTAAVAAVPIAGLYNTGVDGTGIALGNDAVDGHWSLVAAPAGYALGNAYTGVSNGVFPISPWLANTATSRWLTPTVSNPNGLNHAAGDYAYTLSFNIAPAQLASSAAFTGRLAADNSVVSILLNGSALTVPGGTNFNVWSDFAASSGFVAGLNTLTILTNNASGSNGNPTGVRVEFLTSSIAGAIPEPATWAMLVLGFGLVGVSARRRQKVLAA